MAPFAGLAPDRQTRRGTSRSISAPCIADDHRSSGDSSHVPSGPTSASAHRSSHAAAPSEEVVDCSGGSVRAVGEAAEIVAGPGEQGLQLEQSDERRRERLRRHAADLLAGVHRHAQSTTPARALVGALVRATTA